MLDFWSNFWGSLHNLPFLKDIRELLEVLIQTGILTLEKTSKSLI